MTLMICIKLGVSRAETAFSRAKNHLSCTDMFKEIPHYEIKR